MLSCHVPWEALEHLLNLKATELGFPLQVIQNLPLRSLETVMVSFMCQLGQAMVPVFGPTLTLP